jgi:hypothetical protein
MQLAANFTGRLQSTANGTNSMSPNSAEKIERFPSGTSVMSEALLGQQLGQVSL